MTNPFSRAGGGPLIVMGMHRSGTSLVARILRDAGAHLGNDLNTHLESRLFLRSNQRVFRAAHAEWDYPQGMRLLLASQEPVEVLVAELAERCGDTWRALQYLGWRRLVGPRLGSRGDVWGWKDPRNTFTLPLWLRLFPSARVLCVRRHVADVVASLVRRELGRRTRLDDPARSERCLDLERSFHLWVEYVTMSEEVLAPVPDDRVLHVSFEELVEEPDPGIAAILAFAGLAHTPESVRQLAARIDVDRCRAYRRQPEMVRFHEAHRSHPLVRRLGYH